MADQKVIIEAESGWSSPSIELVSEDGNTLVTTASANPGSVDGTLYSAVFVDRPAGRYRVRLMSGGDPQSLDWVDLGAAEADYPCEGLAGHYQSRVALIQIDTVVDFIVGHTQTDIPDLITALDGELFKIGDTIIRTVVSDTEEELRERLTKLV